MSKLFYDNLLNLDEVKQYIDDVVETLDEKEELWKLVDEIVHTRILSCILDNLSIDLHEDFICQYHEKPHDVGISLYLKKNLGENYEELIISEVRSIKEEIISDLGLKP